jgi:hypothetical protein
MDPQRSKALVISSSSELQKPKKKKTSLPCMILDRFCEWTMGQVIRQQRLQLFLFQLSFTSTRAVAASPLKESH